MSPFEVGQAASSSFFFFLPQGTESITCVQLELLQPLSSTFLLFTWENIYNSNLMLFFLVFFFHHAAY